VCSTSRVSSLYAPGRKSAQPAAHARAHARTHARARARATLQPPGYSRASMRALLYVSRLYRYHRISVEHVSLTCTYLRRTCARVRARTRGRANAARLQFLGRDAHTRAHVQQHVVTCADVHVCVCGGGGSGGGSGGSSNAGERLSTDGHPRVCVAYLMHRARIRRTRMIPAGHIPRLFLSRPLSCAFPRRAARNDDDTAKAPGNAERMHPRRRP